VAIYLSIDVITHTLFPLYLESSPVTPDGVSFAFVRRAEITPGWINDTLDPVSIISTLECASTTALRVGAPFS